MPDEDKNFGGSLVLDFRKWWRHMQAKDCKFEGWSNKHINEFNKISITRVVVSRLSADISCVLNLSAEENCNLTGLNAFSVSLYSKCSSTPPFTRHQLYLCLFIMITIVKWKTTFHQNTT